MAEVEDVSMLRLKIDYMCGSKGLIAVYVENNGACTLTVFGC